MSREPIAGPLLAGFIDSLVDDFDIVEVLTTLAHGCVDAVGASASGIMLLAPQGRLHLMASSSDDRAVNGLFELESEEGPSNDCCRSGEPVLDHHLADADDRWSRFAPAARQAGFDRVDAIPLRLRHQAVGAISLLHQQSPPLDESDLATMNTMAGLATLAVFQHNAARRGHRRVEEQLRQAIRDRVVIEQATGMVAERDGIDIGQALARIHRRAARDRHRLADVAADIIDHTLNPAELEPAVTTSSERLPSA